MNHELYQAVRDLPIIDVHSHLPRDRMAAGDLGMVLFYHMIQYALRAAGADQDKLWPSDRSFHESKRPYDEFIAHWPQVANTGFGWALRAILRDLYEFDEPITAQSLPRLEAAFTARTAQQDWPLQVLARAGVARVLSSRINVPPLGQGQPDPGIRFTVESSPITGTREYVPWRQRLTEMEKRTGREINTAADLRQAVSSFYGRFDWSDKRGLVWWFSSEANFRPTDDETIDGIIADVLSGGLPDPGACRLLEAACVRAVCQAIRGRTGIFQMVYGVQFLTPDRPHPVARTAPQFASSLGWLIGEFPDIHFDILSGYEPDEPVLCSLCLGYPNVSLSGFWWQTFYPSVMHAAWHRRLDMVPTPRLCGFFSDGYCVDWIYGRAAMTRRVLANVLDEKIRRGFYTFDQAVQVAREVLFETPKRLFLGGQP